MKFILALAPLCASSLALAQPRYGAIGELYEEACSACHGNALEGTPLGVPLVGAELAGGTTPEAVEASIRDGNPDINMPAFQGVLAAEDIQSLAIYVLEQRQGYTYDPYGIRSEIEVLSGIQTSEHHDFVLTSLIEGLAPLPYSLAPLSDGRLLLSEKKRGLTAMSIVMTTQ